VCVRCGTDAASPAAAAAAGSQLAGRQLGEEGSVSIVLGISQQRVLEAAARGRRGEGQWQRTGDGRGRGGLESG
jgi:hypothetical protein